MFYPQLFKESDVDGPATPSSRHRPKRSSGHGDTLGLMSDSYSDEYILELAQKDLLNLLGLTVSWCQVTPIHPWEFGGIPSLSVVLTDMRFGWSCENRPQNNELIMCILFTMIENVQQLYV